LDFFFFNLRILSNCLFLFIQFPALNRGTLESSGIGLAVKCLYQHPKETKGNKEKAGRLINQWDPKWFPRVVLQRFDEAQEP